MMISLKYKMLVLIVAVSYKIKLRTNLLLSLFKMWIIQMFSVYICWMMQCFSSFKMYIYRYKYNLNKNPLINFIVWFHSWLCMMFGIIHNIPKFDLDLDCVTLLQIFRQNAQIEHYSYKYLLVFFLGLACDGKMRGDPIYWNCHQNFMSYWNCVLKTLGPTETVSSRI